MAEMKISNTMWNDTKEGIIAWAEQLKDRLLKNYIANLSERDRGRIPDDIKLVTGVFQERLNEFFLKHWLDFQSFLKDEGIDPETIDSWHEVQEFLKGLPDDEAKWLQTTISRLDNRITAMDIPDGGAYDVSADHVDGSGNYAVYARLSDAINAIPPERQKGGMSIKFIQGNAQSSDNKYVQARCMAQNFTTDVTQWQSVDIELITGSKNLIESGTVDKSVRELNEQINKIHITSDAAGVTSFVFKSGVTYRVKNNGSSTISISHRNTPDGTSEDIFQIDPNTERNYTPTTDGLYLRYGMACNLDIYQVGSVYDVSNQLKTKLNVIDSYPTENSSNLVESGGVYNNIVYRLIHLVGIANYVAGVTKVGDIYFNTASNKLKKCITFSESSFTFEDVPFYDGAIYTYNNELYVYNGMTLVKTSPDVINDLTNPSTTKALSANQGKVLNEKDKYLDEKLIKLFAISTYRPSGIQVGEYYYNKNTEKLYLITSLSGGPEEITKHEGALYICDGIVYTYNGTTLVPAKGAIVDNLNSSDATTPLSAKQGKVLNEKVEPLLNEKPIPIKIFYQSNPNYSSAGYLSDGDRYWNTLTKKLYKIVNGSGTEESIDVNKLYECQGINYKYDSAQQVFVPQLDTIFLEDLPAPAPHPNGVKGFYSSSGKTVAQLLDVSGSTLIANVTTISFIPASNTIFIYKGKPYTFDSFRLSDRHIDNIELQKVEYKTYPSIVGNIDWTKIDEKTTLMDQLHALFDGLISNHPNYVTKDNAYTFANVEKAAYASDYETYIYHFHTSTPTGKTRPRILIVAGTHGNEIWSGFVLYAIMKGICDGSDNNSFIMRTTFDIDVIPCLNGYGIINDSRTNGNDVDINRNFDADWESGAHAGTSAFSEAESQLIKAITEKGVLPICAFDMHSYWSNDTGAIYTNVESYERVIRLSAKEIAYTLMTEKPAIFGAVDSHFYDKTSNYQSIIDSTIHGVMKMWWSDIIPLGSTIEVSNVLNYSNGGYVGGYDEHSQDAFDIAVYTMKVQLMKLCEKVVNSIHNFYF